MRLARSLAAILGVCALMVLVPAASAPAASAPLTPVTIATLPLEPAALAFYAHHRGFFRQQGLDAKLLVLSDPSQLVAALLSGDATVSGFNVGGAAVLKTRNAPVRVIAAGAVYSRAAPTTAVVAARGETIVRARDLVGKRIGIDATNTIAHIGLLKWLKGNGVAASEVRLVELPFAQMVGPLGRGTIDAAILPEPYVTLALQRGAKRVANVLHTTCAADCLLTVWLTRRDTDPLLAARFRNAIQAAAVWANQPQNDAASGAILARYVPVDKAVLTKMTRTRFAQRLRPALAQPWIDAFAEFGVIPASFRALDLIN
jgi:NitT/TauT family transport system substrate-binding protein